MDLTIALGWWLAPALVTLASFGYAYTKLDLQPTSGFGTIGAAIGNTLILGVALVLSLTAWLIWALLS